MILTEWDAEHQRELYRRDGIEEGIALGIEQGREQGVYATLASLVSNGLLTPEQAEVEKAKLVAKA